MAGIEGERRTNSGSGEGVSCEHPKPSRGHPLRKNHLCGNPRHGLKRHALMDVSLGQGATLDAPGCGTVVVYPNELS